MNSNLFMVFEIKGEQDISPTPKVYLFVSCLMMLHFWEALIKLSFSLSWQELADLLQSLPANSPWPSQSPVSKFSKWWGKTQLSSSFHTISICWLLGAWSAIFQRGTDYYEERWLRASGQDKLKLEQQYSLCPLFHSPSILPGMPHPWQMPGTCNSLRWSKWGSLTFHSERQQLLSHTSGLSWQHRQMCWRDVIPGEIQHDKTA